MKQVVGLSTRSLHLQFKTLLAAICTVCLIGCGGTGEDLGSVTGTITLNGKPLPGVVVEYSPTGGSGSMAMGLTDESGHYEMMFSMNQKGASLGNNKVTISTSDAGLPGADGETIKEIVPAEYNSNSTLEATVTAGANVIDFKLESSDGSEIVQPDVEL